MNEHHDPLEQLFQPQLHAAQLTEQVEQAAHANLDRLPLGLRRDGYLLLAQSFLQLACDSGASADRAREVVERPLRRSAMASWRAISAVRSCTGRRCSRSSASVWRRPCSC